MNVSQLLKHGSPVETLPCFLSPIVKHLLELRKNAINKRDDESSHTSPTRKGINKLIRNNQLKAVKQENKNHNCGSRPKDGGH